MTEVIPAIIAESFEDLKGKMSRVEGLAPIAQLDVCDGEFVPSKCWPYIGDEENDFKKILEEDEGFPFWETLDFEADLMIKNPENFAKDWIKAGAKRIILHIESSEYLYDFVKELREEYGYFGEGAVDVEIGIGINIETSNEDLYKFLDAENGKSLADFVQFMGIKKIGYQGQSFDDEVLDKISSLREAYPDVIISIDGGVNFENAKDLVEAGVNRLVSGSAIFESENIEDAIETLKNS
jgi:ribulose-phosphate 3-epimerase